MSYADVGSNERTAINDGSGTTSIEDTPLGVSRIDPPGPNGTVITRDPDGNLISLRYLGDNSYYVLDALGSVLAMTDSTMRRPAARPRRAAPAGRRVPHRPSGSTCRLCEGRTLDATKARS